MEVSSSFMNGWREMVSLTSMGYLLDTKNGVHFTQLILCKVAVDTMIPVNFLPGRIG